MSFGFRTAGTLYLWGKVKVGLSTLVCALDSAKALDSKEDLTKNIVT